MFPCVSVHNFYFQVFGWMIEDDVSIKLTFIKNVLKCAFHELKSNQKHLLAAKTTLKKKQIEVLKYILWNYFFCFYI